MNRRRFVLTAAAAATVLASCSDKAAQEPAAAKPAVAPSAQEAYDLAAKQGHGFTIGAVMAANTVYVFFDPTCPHCAALWTNARSLLHKLKMVWIPISILHGSSTAQGATILSAPDPEAAMNENEASVLDRKGGITASSSLSDDMVGQVKANTDLFTKLGADSVPFIVYKNAKTGAFATHSGAVPADELASMVGI